MDYRTYIESEDWRRSHARLTELRASGFRCRICNGRGPDGRLEVHHRTYVRLGRELPGDLTTLCPRCHRLATWIRKQTFRGRKIDARP